MRIASAIFMFHNEAILHLQQIVTYTRLWRKNGGTKVVMAGWILEIIFMLFFAYIAV